VTSTNGVLLDATGGSGNFIGHDVETRVQWKINDNWNFDAGYTHWFKDSYFDRLPASAGLPQVETSIPIISISRPGSEFNIMRKRKILLEVA